MFEGFLHYIWVLDAYNVLGNFRLGWAVGSFAFAWVVAPIDE